MEIEKRELFSLEKLKEEFFTYSLLRQQGVTLQGKMGEEVLEADFSKITIGNAPDLERQELILKGLSLLFQNALPQAITLRNCQVLTAEKLIPFLHDKLVYLDISYSSIQTLPVEIEKCPLQELYLSESSITQFEKSNGLTKDHLSLPLLKKLHLARCHSLRTIQLKAPFLQELKANKNLLLSRVSLKSGLVAAVYLEDSPKINLETIVSESYPELQPSLSLFFYEELGLYLATLLETVDKQKRGLTIGSEVLRRFQEKTELPLLPQSHIDLSQLKVEGMHFQDMNPKEAKALGALFFHERLKQVYLSTNLNGQGIKSEGGKAIMAALPFSAITELTLNSAHIDSSAVKALAEVLPKTSLVSLTLDGEEISERSTYTTCQRNCYQQFDPIHPS